MYHNLQKNVAIQSVSKSVLQTTLYQLRTKLLIFAPLLLIFSFAVTAKADWSTDITPICVLPEVQGLADVKTGEGEIAFLWLDYSTTSPFNRCMIQQFDNSGTVKYPTNGIAVSSYGIWNQASVLGVFSNYLDTAWFGYPQIGSDFTIVAQRTQKNDATLWGSNGVQIIYGDIESDTFAMCKLSNSYFFSFLKKNGEGNYDLCVQQLLEDGSLPWGNIGRTIITNIASGNNPFNSGFTIIPIEPTNIVMVWSGGKSIENDLLRAQMIDNVGKKVWNENWLDIGPHLKNEYNVHASLVLSNKIIITWRQDDEEYKSSSFYAQLLTIEGEKLYPSNGLFLADQSIPEFSPPPLAKQCIYSNGNKLFFYWSGYTNSIGNTKWLSYQSLDIVSGHYSGKSNGWHIAEILNSTIWCITNNDCEIIMCWEQNQDIYYQILDEFLNPNFTLPGEPVIVEPGFQNFRGGFDIINNKQAVIGWTDKSNYNIYAKAVEIIIPEPCTILFFIFLLLLFHRNYFISKISIIMLAFIFTSDVNGKLGPADHAGNYNWNYENKVQYYNNNNGDYYAIGFESGGLLVEGGSVYSPSLTYYIGMYNTINPHSWMELANGNIDFGGTLIDFNSMRLTDVRTPLSTETLHAANVQFVINQISSSISDMATRTWVIANYYEKSQSDSRYYTQSYIMGNYYSQVQSDSRYLTGTYIYNNFYDKSHILNNYYDKQHILANYYTKPNLYTQTETENYADSAASIAVNNLKNNGGTFRNDIVLNNLATTSPKLSWLSYSFGLFFYQVNANLSGTQGSKWSLRNSRKINLGTIYPPEISFELDDYGTLYTPLQLKTNQVIIQGNLNMQNNRIINLDDGINNKDAINLSQLNSGIGGLQGQINILDNRVDGHDTDITNLYETVAELGTLQMIVTNGSESVTNFLITEATFDMETERLENKITTGDAENKIWTENNFYFQSTLDDKLNGKLNVAGGTMSGEIKMNGNDITGAKKIETSKMRVTGGALDFDNVGLGTANIRVNNDNAISISSSGGSKLVSIHGESSFSDTLYLNGNKITGLKPQTGDADDSEVASVGFVANRLTDLKESLPVGNSALVSGGGEISWDGEKASWTKRLIAAPVGSAATVFSIPSKTFSSVYEIQIPSKNVLYIRPATNQLYSGGDIEIIPETSLIADYEPASTDIVLAYHNSDDGALYWVSGWIIPEGAKRAVSDFQFSKYAIATDYYKKENIDTIINDVQQTILETKEMVSSALTEGNDSTFDDLICTTLKITGDQDWHVGSDMPGGGIDIIMHQGKITSDGGHPLTLSSDTGSIELDTPMRLDLPEDMKGNAIFPKNNQLDPNNQLTIANNNCSANSVVIITPKQDPKCRYWVVPAEGSFTIHRNTNSEFKFQYLIIN